MKKIKKLTLTEMSKKGLSEKQMKLLKGGSHCFNKCGTSVSSLSSVYPEWMSLF